MPLDDHWANEAFAEAGTDFALNYAAEALAEYGAQKISLFELLIGLSMAGAEAQRVLLTGYWPFLEEPAA